MAPERNLKAADSGVEKFSPLLELTLARVREFVREPETVFWVFVFPVLLALALGIAFRNQPPQKPCIAVEDQGPSAAGIKEMLARSKDLEVKLLATPEAAQALRSGRVDLVVKPAEVPENPGVSSVRPLYSFRYDPTRPASRLASLLTQDALERGLGRKDLAEIKAETVIEPGARYIDFLIPGLIGMNLMGSGMWGIGFNVVTARSKKLLKRLAATPMRRSHYLLAFMLSRTLFLVPEVAALVVFGWLVFDSRMYGSILGFAVVAILGSFTFAGLGLLVATRTSSMEAVQGWLNLVMMPMYLLSGCFFPYSRFPEFSWPLIRLLPLTALNDALRAIMNDGVSLHANWRELGVLLVWGLVSFVLALRFFKWQ